MALRFVHGFSLRVAAVQDVKSPNVLLAADYTAKISDVGLAKLQNKDYLSAQQQVGTFTWSVSAWNPKPAPFVGVSTSACLWGGCWTPKCCRCGSKASTMLLAVRVALLLADTTLSPLTAVAARADTGYLHTFMAYAQACWPRCHHRRQGVPMGDWCIEKGDMQSG